MNRSGFTLIELIVVVMIVGILAGIGIPQYFRSMEESRANSGASLAAMVATTNRMFAIDHATLAPNNYAKGKLATAACNAELTAGCPPNGGPPDGCWLVACKYLAAQDFDNNAYTAYADDGNGGTCSGLGFGAGKWVACVVRQSCPGGSSCATISPYTNWGYAIDQTGKIGYRNNCNAGSPACPAPVQ